MLRKVLFVVLLTASIVRGQNTKKIIDKETQETYYVLKTDQSIRHGNYQKKSYNGKLEIEGYYKEGVKDSIWSFYDYNGELQQKYNYTTNQLVFWKKDDVNTKFNVIKETDTLETNLERPPIYIGGDVMMFEYLNKNLSYPNKAKENNISGDVIIIFTIDENGKTSNHKVKKGIGFGCDESAINAVKSIPDYWIAGVLNGQFVKVEFLMPIRFRLN